MRRAFRIDALACPCCGGRLRLLATITDLIQIRRLLDHLGLESSIPQLSRPRPPPQFEFFEPS
jgi:hypothetical protein